MVNITLKNDSYENSDVISEEHKYDFDKPLQQEILGSLLKDKIFLLEHIELIRPEFFEDPAHQAICKILHKYFEDYKSLPTQICLEEEIRILNPKALKYYLSELQVVLSAYQPYYETRDYISTKIFNFAKLQKYKSVQMKSIQIMSEYGKSWEEKWRKIEELNAPIFMMTKNTDLGQSYFEDINDRYERLLSDTGRRDIFTCGFSKIDELINNGGLTRGEIGAFIGPPGGGKSVALYQSAYKNAVQGKKVLIISLEMNKDQIGLRLDAFMSKIPMASLLSSKDEVSVRVAERLQEIKQSVAAFDKEEFTDTRIRIQQFPSGAIDVIDIRAYMAKLKLYGWAPDLVIIDYIGEFKDVQGVKTYETRERQMRQLRRLAIEENVCVLTAMQPNRSGKEALKGGDVIDDSHTGDSYGMNRILDAIWSINQDKDEKTMNVGKIWVIKHRNGRSREVVYFKQDTKTLEMFEINEQAWREAKSKAGVVKTEFLDKEIKDYFNK